jgi:hypothetical protein
MSTPTQIRAAVEQALRMSTKTVTDVETKLPNWGCDLVFDLARRVATLEAERDEAQDLLASQTGVQLETGGTSLGVRVPKQKYVHVTPSWTDALRVRFDHGSVEVTGNGPLQIVTQGSNILQISEAHR